MPIEIRELVIKGNVGSSGQGDRKRQDGKEAQAPAATPQPLSHGEKRDIIMECVHEVMERLSQSRDL
jgi:hypothetical protein